MAEYDPSFVDVIRRAREGEISFVELLSAFLTTTVMLPSSTFVGGGQHVSPIFYERDGNAMIAVFSSLELIGSDVSDSAPYAATISGLDVVKGAKEGVGIGVNPGTDIGFEIDAATVSQIRTASP